MNTTENNKLIAEFMGYKPAKCSRGFVWDIGKSIPDNQHPLPIQGRLITPECSYLRFNTDWNWLMLVVEKIENKLKIKIDISLHICRIHVNEDYTIVISENMGKIESVYTAVIKFIKWYNLQK